MVFVMQEKVPKLTVTGNSHLNYETKWRPPFPLQNIKCPFSFLNHAGKRCALGYMQKLQHLSMILRLWFQSSRRRSLEWLPRFSLEKSATLDQSLNFPREPLLITLTYSKYPELISCWKKLYFTYDDVNCYPLKILIFLTNLTDFTCRG